MKKIVFITPALTGGGSERVMTELANYMVKQNYEITFLITSNSKIEYELDERVNVDCLHDNLPVSILSQIKLIRNHMKKNSNCVYISFFVHQSIYSILAGLGLKVDIIVSERNDPKRTVNGIVDDLLRKFLYAFKSCKAIVFQTQDAMNYFSKRLQKKGVIILNPLKADLPTPIVIERRKSFVSVARLEKQKNYPMLFNAFSLLLNDYPDYKLEIYGKGTLETELRELAERLNISHAIEFCGFAKNVNERIIASSAFVLSSDYEGLSNSMIEAVAMGLPSVCTDCPIGGARMFIEDGFNGYLTPVGDANEMYLAMKKTIENKKILEENSYKKALYVKKQLNIGNIVKQWLTVINN